ncbi:MAG: MCE family protein [Cytophagales bacterium]|nr:MCE family protein [Cytophagales bacterium]
MKREVKIGLLTLVSSVLLYLGFNFLKGKDFFTTDNTYYVLYDRIDGLTVSNMVTLNGFKIGRVDNIEIQHDKDDSLLVSIQIDRGVLIASKAVAFLTDDGLLGGKKIVIKNKGDIKNPIQSGGALIAQRDRGLMDVVSSKVDPVITRVNTTVDNLNNILDTQAKKNLQNTLQNLENTSLVLNQIMLENKRNIGAISTNLTVLSNSLNETVKQTQPLIANLNSLADSLNDLELKKTVNNINGVLTNLNSVVAKVDSGQGTLSKLINEKELYTDLNQTVKDLDSLFVDMKDNPKRYVHFSVFGKKDKE